LTDEDAEDAACEALEELPAAIRAAKDLSELKPLVAQIACNRGISLARKKGAAKRGTNETASLEEMIEDGLEVAQAVGSLSPAEMKELLTLLQTSLSGLDDQTTSMIKDHFWLGMTYQEIADKHRTPLGTVCVRFSRGLAKIRASLKQNTALLKELTEHLR